MPPLSIKNIVTITDIDRELNKINVFLGPQSSGKSTIARIISFCQWLQKDVALRQGVDHIDKAFVKTNLIDYHNISGYFKPESEFHYIGDKCVDISYSDGELKVKLSDNIATAVVAKNAYIPSERNIVGVPNIFQIDMPNNYLRSFLKDWMNVRDKFRNADAVQLLDLGVSYFYKESSAEDMIRLDNDPAGLSLPLSQASSGLQSTTPLYVYIKYLTEWIYQHDEDRSPQRMQLIREGAARGVIYQELDGAYGPEDKDRIESLAKRLAAIPDTVSNDDSMLVRLREIESRLKRSNCSNIVVEEPEQNLFPQTQAMLIYSILSMINTKRDNLVITTHSPFVIYALNNCMLGFLATDRLAKLPHLGFSHESVIDPALVSIWELRDGRLKSPHHDYNQTIQDVDGLIRDNYFDRVMKGLMTDFKNIISVSKS